jgi:hypothetical protein
MVPWVPILDCSIAIARIMFNNKGAIASPCLKTLLHLKSSDMFSNHVKWLHCHHGMVRPRVADKGDGLQILRVAANMLNKQSRTAECGWSSSLGVERAANNPPP